MAYDPSIFNINPYYDDFDAGKGFLRVLFKPGYALQARELTQAQSILQNQLSKIGDHLFKDGSRIVGGGISVRNADYLMVSVGSGSPLETVTDYETFVGGFLSDAGGNRAKVVHYIEPDPQSDGYLILVVDFVSGSQLNDSLNFEKDGVNLINGIQIPSTGFITSSFNNFNQIDSPCKLISVSDGIFYIDGFFVRVDTQHFTPFAYSDSYRDLSFNSFSTLSKKIGFYVSRDSVTEQEDSTLRDPAIGSYNYNAPGADRFKIVLSLGQAELNETPNDFVELLRFEGGRITKKIDRVTYGDIERALARRTYDESGSYSVKPFDVIIKPGAGDTFLNASVSGGKAYVLGFEVENQHPQGISLEKARTTQTETDVRMITTVGNQIGVVISSGQTFTNNVTAIGSASATVLFYDSTNSIVARGFVHGAIPNPSEFNSATTAKIGYGYNLYLYGISGDVSSGLSGEIYLGPSGTTLATAFVPTTPLSLTNNSSLVYPIEPGYAIDSIQSLRIVGKLIGNDIVSNPIGRQSANNVTTFTVSKNHFSGTITSSGSSAFRFLNYGTNTEPSTNNDDLIDIAFILASGSAASNTLVPFSGSVSTNGDGSIAYVSVAFVPSDFLTQNIKAVFPVLYTPNIANPSTYRTKRSERVVNQNLGSLIVDESGRSYFRIQNTDVYTVESVVGSDGTDYTNDFELDDGQRDTYYDNSRLYVKKSLINETRYNGTTPIELRATYSYFRHEGLLCAPFIGKHSYVNIPYDRIPLYTDQRTGKTVSLANCLDFRHSTPTSTTPMIKPYGRSEFGSSEDTRITYTHYLPRIDKLCVKADPDDGSPLFFFEKGTPDLSPTAPPDPSDGLVIAALTIPSYTHNPSDVVVTPVDNKRYTMGDIGKMQRRVDDVEVFAKLSLSELEVESKSLKTDSDSIEPLKTSIFSDEFYGHSVADVSDSDHICSVDYERGEMRPYFVENNQTVSNFEADSSVRITSDGIAILDYKEVPYIENSQYTKTVNINPSNTVNWLGFMTLSREIDAYYDLGFRPLIKTNSLMENDNWISANPNNSNGFGTQWNGWESIWTGIEEVEEEQDDIQKRIVGIPRTSSTSAVRSFNGGSVRTGTSRTVESVNQKTSKFIRARKLRNRIKYKIGSKIVDRSIVPYIPGQANLVATVHGLKPNTSALSLYFDGEVIKTGISTNENGTVVKSDGSVGITFSIPSGRFLCGSRTVRISNNPVTENSTIAAEAVYHCTGLINQSDSGSNSVRPPHLRRQTTSSETISKDPFNRDIDAIESSHWSDPLSQTFFVDKKTNPDGIYISSVTLFFSSKDSSLPVTVQIRPTVGGYPSPSVCLPFSTVTLMPNDVNASSSPTGTVFTFSTPVYLQPGEYSLCILANSDDYSLFAAETAINTVTNLAATSGRAGNNQLLGSLFTPQGVGAAVQNNLTDLMFTINRCDFTSLSGKIIWRNLLNLNGCQVVKVYASELVPFSSAIDRTIANPTIPFKNNESIYPKVLFSSPTGTDMEYTLRRGFNVSPMVDTQSMYCSGFEMLDDSSYVSRIIELPEDLVSNGISVFLDANLPKSSGMSVEYRYSVNGESDLFTKQWNPMPLVNPAPVVGEETKPFTSVSEIDFREAQYRTAEPLPSFKAYQIRVKLHTDTGFGSDQTYYNTPAIRNIKAVSFIES
jgi:hypothetical protein